MDLKNFSVADLLHKRWNLAMSMKTVSGTYSDLAFQCHEKEFMESKEKLNVIESNVEKSWEVKSLKCCIVMWIKCKM
jgi:hypothetical protein